MGPLREALGQQGLPQAEEPEGEEPPPDEEESVDEGEEGAR
jgi:hypothetical protein